jgi:hypothetical protein
LTLAALANAKRLDAEKLIAWHVRELPDGGIEIPYLNATASCTLMRYRFALEKVRARFKWRKDDTTILYGLWRLCEWGDATRCTCAKGKAILGLCGMPTCLHWAYRTQPLGNPSGGARWRVSSESC